MNTEGANRIEEGNSFQSLGAIDENARSPLDFSLVFGVNNSLWFEDRRDLVSLRSIKSSDIYEGAIPCSDLNTINTILKSTL